MTDSMTSSVKFIREARAGGVRPEQQVRAQKFDPSGKKMAPYSRRDYYKVWMPMGEGRINYATKTVELSQASLIFSNPRVPYSYEPITSRGGYMCIFTEDFARTNGRVESLQESPLFKIGSNPVFFLDEQQQTTIAALFEKIVAELESSYIYRFDVVRNYLDLIIHEGLKMEPALNATRYHNAAERIASLFLELLERQFPIESPAEALKLKKASDYANSLSVHVNHLNHAVREVTGKSTSAVIADRVVLEAMALLRHTDLSIADIAYCLGFDYPNYFNNFFKKSTGMTPLSVRK